MNTDSLDSPKVTHNLQIVPMWKRVIAFAMDMILIIVLLQSTLPFIPIYLEWIAMAGVIFFIFLSLFNYLNQEGRLIFKKIL